MMSNAICEFLEVNRTDAMFVNKVTIFNSCATNVRISIEFLKSSNVYYKQVDIC